ncbi:MAG: NADH:quinone oxidoreductase [Idiomarina sp.]|nr:MAG: NADH:quinone oxidoreductase [Idiomarina sp.]
MMRFLQWLHRWTSLIIIIQVLLWIISGFYFSLAGHHAMSGHHYFKMEHSHSPIGTSQALDWPQISNQFSDIRDVQLRTILGTPQYVIEHADGVSYIDATTAQPWSTSEEMAATLAQESYSGSGEIIGVTPLTEGSDEVNGWREPGYRVDIRDDLNTRIYIDAASGTVVEHRNTPWLWADWAFKLHFMDYSGERNFNHLLIVSAGVMMLWFTLSGLILLGRNLVRGDLNPWRKQTYLEFFQTQQKTIASACGGGGTCGLCKVRFQGGAPSPTDSEQAILSTSELNEGLRLSCQHRLNKNYNVGLTNTDARSLTLKLVHNRVLTPSIHELTFVPANGVDLSYQAGQFMQFFIPCDAGQNTVTVHRNYSFATASGQPELTFTVRRMPAPNTKCQPGIGSTYLCGLQMGETVGAVGPLGDFLLNTATLGERQQVFIGGGAGIAPLRALIQDALERVETAHPLQFFYGARNRSELCYYDEFVALQEQQRLQYHPVISEQDDTWRGLSGFVHEIAKAWIQTQDVQQLDVYVCGPPAMLAATRAMLDEIGVAPEQVRYDDFGI